MNTLKIMVLTYILFISSSCRGVSEKNANSISYIDMPVISTCSNDEVLMYELRIVSQGTPSIHNVRIDSIDDIKIYNTALREGDILNRGYREYFLEIKFDVPKASVNYDLILETNEGDYELTGLKNVDYGTKENRILQFVFVSGFDEGLVGYQEIFNNVLVKEGEDGEKFNFFVLSEDEIEVKKNNTNDFSIVVNTNHPQILGYAYEYRNENYCIDNMYQTIYIDEDFMERSEKK